MKLVVFGTSEFAVPALAALAERHAVVAVVTQPDRPAGRGHRLAEAPVKRAARSLGLHVLTPDRLLPFVAEARALDADAFVVASYGKIVPRALLDVVPVALNVHPSLLPLYRGATPIQSAIRDGRTETGVTIIAMDAGMDTGDVVLQERTEIGAMETYGELHDRLAQQGAVLLLDAVEAAERGKLSRTPQSALGVPAAEIAATLTRPLRKEDLVIDWTVAPQRIVDLVRSLAPAPAARGTIEGETIKIRRARVARAGEAHGTLSDDGGYVHRGVVLLEVVPPSRGVTSGAAWRRSAVRS